MSSSSDLNLKPTETSSASKPKPKLDRIKPIPKFQYLPSRDGLDSNLLIILHGLGDTEEQYVKLSQKLNLPQTAILALRGLGRVPLLEEDSFQWWESFDLLTGSTISSPNPTKTLDWLAEIVESLVSPSIGWSIDSIHLFGFGQGGSCASEFILAWSRRPMIRCLKEDRKDEDQDSRGSFGSLVTVSGPLLSLPTIPNGSRSDTPVLFWIREGQDSIGGKHEKEFLKGFKNVQKFVGRSTGGEEMRFLYIIL